jgi:YVTN family beta-propeller protein
MGPARQDLWALAGAGALVLIAALAAQLLMDGGRSSPSAPASVPGDSLAAIDPGTNRVVAEFPVGDTPTSVSVGAGAAWTLSADEQTVSRVDPQTETVKTFATGALPIDLAAGGDALWVLQGEKSGAHRASYDAVSTPAAVARIDPLSGARRGTSPLPVPATATLRVPPGDLVAATNGAVWSVGRPGWVHRLDTDSGRVLTQRSLDAFGIAAGDGQVWIRDRQNRVVRLDRDTGRAVARVALPAGTLSAIAIGAGSVWLTDPVAGTVWRLDSGRLEARTIAVAPGVDSVAVGAGAVWATNRVRGTVTRIDPSSNRVTATISLGNSPRGVAVGRGRVRVAVAGSGPTALPATGGLRAGAKVKALTAPPCGLVVTGRDGNLTSWSSPTYRSGRNSR